MGACTSPRPRVPGQAGSFGSRWLSRISCRAPSLPGTSLSEAGLRPGARRHRGTGKGSCFLRSVSLPPEASLCWNLLASLYSAEQDRRLQQVGNCFCPKLPFIVPVNHRNGATDCEKKAIRSLFPGTRTSDTQFSETGPFPKSFTEGAGRTASSRARLVTLTCLVPSHQDACPKGFPLESTSKDPPKNVLMVNRDVGPVTPTCGRGLGTLRTERGRVLTKLTREKIF